MLRRLLHISYRIQIFFTLELQSTLVIFCGLSASAQTDSVRTIEPIEVFTLGDARSFS